MADEAEGEEKKSNMLLIILLGVGGLLLLAVGLLLGFLVYGGNSADPSAEVEQIIERQEKAAKPEAADEDATDEEGATAEEELGEDGLPKKKVKDVPVVETFDTTYYEFTGNMTTNLRDSRKFLQVGVAVSTQYDDQVMANVDSHQAALRSEILIVMSEFNETEIQGRAGKQKLADSIRDAINVKLEELEGFGGVEHVLFTSFVLQ